MSFRCAMTNNRHNKTEVLTANYPIEENIKVKDYMSLNINTEQKLTTLF